MKRYDPLEPPDPKAWLDLDEDERILLVRAYHRRMHEKTPNPRLHAMFHVMVETQAAMGDETPVARTLERLQAEGLDRHDAVHAVGSVLAERTYAVLKGEEPDPELDLNEAYRAALEALTAEGWIEDYS